VTAALGRADEAERHYREYVARRKPDDALRIEIGDFYRDFGREDEALSWYRRVADREKLGREAARRIWQIEVEREARRYGFSREPESIPTKARSIAAKGRVLYLQRRIAEAERLLRLAVRLAPQFAGAQADLGDVLRDAGRRREAELAYLRALAVEPGNAEISVRLGDLYLAERTPGRAGEAALFLARALQLRPDWTHLHLPLARAYRAAGNLRRALTHVSRFLAEAPDGAARREAVALKQAIEPLLPAGAVSGPPEPGASGGAQLEALRRARALLARGEVDAALAELRRLPAERRTTSVLNLQGRILHAAGRLEEAAAAFNLSLRLNEAQAGVHEQIGVIRMRQGDEATARGHFGRAEALGNAASTYHLARLDAGDEDPGAFGWLGDLTALGRLGNALARLDRFLEQGGSSVHLEEARALKARVEGRRRAVLLGWSAVALAILGAAWLVRRRIWGGVDLRTLLERRPEAGPEVQRILSAIRHEVLKHNTLVLTGLVEAVERGEGAAEKAAFCGESLLGQGGKEGAIHRLEAYGEQLAQVGRNHGERLNLRRKDPALSALLRGFGLLRRVESLLGRVDHLGDRERARLVRTLRIAARLLNVEGYEAVRALLERLRVLEVDRDLLVAIYERTCREPALAAAAIAPLDLDLRVPIPLGVVVPRQAFEDILTNLIRNAIQSSMRHGQREVQVGLAAQSEVDPITGIERAVFLVRDRSPQVLTTEMLRGRYIEEGLGLTADLVSRYEGTLDVLPGEDGWSKAVAVKLPRAEPAAAGAT
jgi:tetratricopeptide (TPR) repeat protein